MTQRRLSSVRAHFLKLAAAAVVPVFVLTGLAVAGEPPMLVTAAGIALATLLVGLAIMVSARFERTTETLKAAITRIARGEEAAITPTFREGDDVVAALTSLETQMRQRSFFSHAAAVLAPGDRGEHSRHGVDLARRRPHGVPEPERARIYRPGRPAGNERSAFPDPSGRPGSVCSPRAWPRQEASPGIASSCGCGAMTASIAGTSSTPRRSACPIRSTGPIGSSPPSTSRSLKQAEELQAQLTQMLERKVAEATDQLRDETSVRQKTERQLAPDPEDGGDQPPDRRHRARSQQQAHGDQRQYRRGHQADQGPAAAASAAVVVARRRRPGRGAPVEASRLRAAARPARAVHRHRGAPRIDHLAPRPVVHERFDRGALSRSRKISGRSRWTRTNSRRRSSISASMRATR